MCMKRNLCRFFKALVFVIRGCIGNCGLVLYFQVVWEIVRKFF